MDIAMLPYFREVRTVEGELRVYAYDDEFDQLVSLGGLFPNLVNVMGEMEIAYMDRLQTLQRGVPGPRVRGECQCY